MKGYGENFFVELIVLFILKFFCFFLILVFMELKEKWFVIFIKLRYL